MACQDDVRRIALSLPGTFQEENNFRFAVMDRERRRYSVHTQAFVWAWSERVHPKKPKVPRPDVIALRVGSMEDKQMLLAADPGTFFDDAHYSGYPVVLVRLAALDMDALAELITDAWACLAPPSLAASIGIPGCGGR